MNFGENYIKNIYRQKKNNLIRDFNKCMLY